MVTSLPGAWSRPFAAREGSRRGRASERDLSPRPHGAALPRRLRPPRAGRQRAPGLRRDKQLFGTKRFCVQKILHLAWPVRTREPRGAAAQQRRCTEWSARAMRAGPRVQCSPAACACTLCRVRCSPHTDTIDSNRKSTDQSLDLSICQSIPSNVPSVSLADEPGGAAAPRRARASRVPGGSAGAAAPAAARPGAPGAPGAGACTRGARQSTAGRARGGWA